MATTTSLIASEIIGVRRVNIFRKFSDRIHRIEVGPASGALQLKDSQRASGLRNRQSSYENYVSAWFKNYGSTSEGGFFRIWHLMISPAFIDSRTKEIPNIVKKIKKRLEL